MKNVFVFIVAALCIIVIVFHTVSTYENPSMKFKISERK